MQPRLKALQRLVTLYAAIEEMHSIELLKMAAAVRETQRAIGVEREVARLAKNDGRGALLIGDRMGWMMAESQQETAVWRRRGLEKIRLEREELNDAAREQYVASRLKREQMNRVLEGLVARMETEEDRRVQAASDDRFLARRRWTDAQEKIQGDQMKAS